MQARKLSLKVVPNKDGRFFPQPIKNNNNNYNNNEQKGKHTHTRQTNRQTDTKVCVHCPVSGLKTHIKTHIAFKTDSHARLGTQSREIETKLIVVTTFLSAMAMVS